MKPRLSLGTSGVLGLGLASFVVFAITLIPGVPPTDSGELGLAAWLPGIAHAPGFPLYTVVAWLWSHLLPVGRVIWRMSLLSALSGAAAVGLTYLLALRAQQAAEQPSSREGTSFLTALAAAAAALGLGLGRTVWTWATVAEVYALNLALMAGILLLVMCSTDWAVSDDRSSAASSLRPRAERAKALAAHPGVSSGRTPGRLAGLALAARPGVKPRAAKPKPSQGGHPLQASPDEQRSHALSPLLLAAFLFGLGLGNHLTSIALLAPAIAFWLTARCGWRFWVSRNALLASLALAAGVAIYLYMPLTAAANPLLNWGQPDTWQRFWWHVTAKQYRVSLLSAPVWPQVIQAGQLWWTQFTPLGIPLLLIGAWRMFRARRSLFWMLLLVVIFATLYAWAYVIEDDGDAYYLPAFLAGAVWVAWGTKWSVGRLVGGLAHASEKAAGSKGPAMAAVVLLATLPVLALAMNWGVCNRRADTITEDYVRDAFAEIGARGLLLTRDWQLYSPSLYLQQVEGLRPDLTVIDTELMRRRWYFDYLQRIAPDLMRSVAAEQQKFLVLRDGWERGEIPDGDPRIGQLQVAYVALLDALIREASAAGRPVHVGPNRGAEPIRSATLAGQPDMESGVGAGWRWLPVGLTFRATRPNAPAASLPALSWQVAAFGQVTPTAPERKIQATRADMAVLRGLAQAQAGNLAGAEADWRLALVVDPAHGPALELLRRLKGQQ